MRKKKTLTPKKELSTPYHRTWSEGEKILLELSCLLPGAAHLPRRVGEYYATLFEAFEAHCTDTLFPRLTATYLANPDPRRRYTHRRTTLQVICRAECDDTTVTVYRTITMKCGRNCHSMDTVEHFRLSDGALLPPKKKTAPRQKRGHKHKKKTCFFDPPV